MVVGMLTKHHYYNGRKNINNDIFSSFEETCLSHSMLANCFLTQRQDQGAMGRWQPPWLLQPLLKISYR
jgi:hypothetical protein